MADAFDRQTFADLAGTSFELQVEEGQVIEAHLHEVSPLGSEGASESGREPFSLVFVLGDDRLLEQRIYPLEHPKLGRVDLFLVPLGPNREGRMQLEAVFT